MTAAGAYAAAVSELIAACVRDEAGAVDAAADIVATSMAAGGLAYVFGSGHSHMLGEEAFFRAGGLAHVCPVLVPPYMLHEGAVRSAELEREAGHGAHVLSGYRLDGGRDCMIVASNSGVNPLPVEVAQRASERGLPVIAIMSRAYSASVDGVDLRLSDVADVVIDNHCPPGDALVRLGEELPAMGPGSTIAGAFLLNSVLLAAAERLLRSGRRPDVYLSANMAGAKELNARSVAALRDRIRHL
jgi:uncharacterized phosphosugar-binding protein